MLSAKCQPSCSASIYQCILFQELLDPTLILTVCQHVIYCHFIVYLSSRDWCCPLLIHFTDMGYALGSITLYIHVFSLTHWGRVTHICVGNLTIIGSDNGLSPGRRQAIIWTSAGILLIGHLGTNFIEILIGIQTFSFTKMHLKMWSAKWRSFCPGLSVLKKWIYSSKQKAHKTYTEMVRLQCFGWIVGISMARLWNNRKHNFRLRLLIIYPELGPQCLR